MLVSFASGRAVFTGVVGLLWFSAFTVLVDATQYNQTELRAMTVVYDSPQNLTLYSFNKPSTGLSKRPASDTMKAALMQSNVAVVIGTAACVATFPAGAAACVAVGIVALIHNFLIFYNPFSILRRDLHERSGYVISEQNTHAEWLPIGDCSTLCRLQAEAEEGVWTAAGNMTVSDIFHDIFFIRSGNVMGFRAIQSLPSDALNKRQYEVDAYGAYVEWYSLEFGEAAWDEFDDDDGAASETDVETFATETILDFSEQTDGVVMCVVMEDDLGPVNTGLWTIWEGAPYDIDLTTVETYLNDDCTPLE